MAWDFCRDRSRVEVAAALDLLASTNAPNYSVEQPRFTALRGRARAWSCPFQCRALRKIEAFCSRSWRACLANRATNAPPTSKPVGKIRLVQFPAKILDVEEACAHVTYYVTCSGASFGCGRFSMRPLVPAPPTTCHLLSDILLYGTTKHRHLISDKWLESGVALRGCDRLQMSRNT